MLIAVTEILGDCSEAVEVIIGEVLCVADCLIDVVSYVDEVGVAEVGRVLHLVGDCERDLAVLHFLQDELDVCDAAEECCECLHVLCV